jgi:DNA-binding Lrp family transcriptional regulator
MADHDRELLQLIAGSPPEALGFAELGREIGISEAEAASLVERLVIEGRLRLVVVGDPAAE